MLKVGFDANAARVVAELQRTRADQLPFAMALAATRTAQDVQAGIRAELPRRFTLRNNFVVGGIRFKPASKRNPEAQVFSRDDFMEIHERGGAKQPQSGRSLSVPIGARANKRGIVTRANRPQALRGRPNVFRARINGLDGLWQRVGRKKRGGQPRGIKLLFAFKSSVPIKPRFGFKATGQKIASDRFSRNMEQAIAQALKTAR